MKFGRSFSVSRLLLYVASICALFQPLIGSAQSEIPNIKEGAWRIAIRMTIPNATGPSTGPTQFDRCMNPKNVEGLLIVPPNAPCVMRKSKLEKESLTWEMSCNQGGFATEAKGKILFKDTRLEGDIDTVAKGPQTIVIKTKIEGRYLGKCVSPAISSPPKTKGTLPKFEDN